MTVKEFLDMTKTENELYINIIKNDKIVDEFPFENKDEYPIYQRETIKNIELLLNYEEDYDYEDNYFTECVGYIMNIII